MSAFYPGLQSTAARLLGDKGQAMTLRQKTPGAYDPSTGTAPITAVDYACQGAVFEFPALLINGTSIQVGDKKVLLAAQGLTVEPDTGDKLVIAGKEWHVIAVKAVAPGGPVVLYQLQVRR